MSLLELPLDLVLNIIESAVLSGDIVAILRLRRVNRKTHLSRSRDELQLKYRTLGLFDREITKGLAKYRLRDVSSWGDDIPLSFELRLVLENVGSQYRGAKEVKKVIHAVTDDLESRLVKLNSPISRCEVLQSVCKAALAFGALWVLSRQLLDDGESTSHRSVGDDESQEILRSSFTVAVASRFTEVQTAMLQDGMDPDFETRYFGIPLKMAAEFGHYDTVKILLDCGSALGRAKNKYSSAALQAAARHGRIAIVQLLLDPKYGLKTYGSAYGEAVDLGTKYRHLDIAMMILERGTGIPSGYRKMICLQAARNGYDNLMVKMLDTGLDVNGINSEASTPIAEAAEAGHCTTVGLLLDRGARVRKFGTDAFVRAARAGQIEILEMMLRRGIDMKADERMFRAFVAAVEGGSSIGAQFLLDNGLDIRSEDVKFWQYSALTNAVINNSGRKNVDAVRWPIFHFGLSPDGDPEAASRDRSPMYLALERGRPEIVNLLFQLGAKLIEPQPKRHGWTDSSYMNFRERAAFDEYQRWEEIKLRQDRDIESPVII